ncbi:triose-phosphate isomerase [Helicobacter sp. faydin-H20]|uniref:triose-phosphate isomerase n=1 Tax=Helicobacter anatolicus TaxID=2905874 RepID=UPI001E5E58F2|nr:triose-phosphate isomerase [Helicobacter anatolicus]MCE3037234.1 triose-phosphate isomerase [Helicobacter anatolicus]
MSKIIAGNFKSNLTRTKIQEYYQVLDSKIMPNDEVFLFPPFFALQQSQKFQIGAQNAYPANNGAFTGEITLEALKDLNINTLLIGHSERRTLLGENQEFCAQKFNFFKAQDFSIFYCIGENLEVRQKGFEMTKKFLAIQLQGIDTNYPNLILAYEPIWAIGTGKSASLEEIEEVHAFLKTLCPTKILYGGSVQKNNLTEILKLPNVDGALIGSASLDVNNFIDMITLARELS